MKMEEYTAKGQLDSWWWSWDVQRLVSCIGHVTWYPAAYVTKKADPYSQPAPSSTVLHL